MASTTLSVPEIHCEHCKASIEGAVAPIDGVDDVEVDVAAAQVRIEHDDDLPLGVLVGAIEDRGYEVPDQEALSED